MAPRSAFAKGVCSGALRTGPKVASVVALTSMPRIVSAVAVLALVALSASSCGSGQLGAGVALTLHFDVSVSDAALASVRSFDVTASGDETYATTLPLSRAALRTERTRYVPGTSTHMLAIAIVARDAAGVAIANGSTASLTLSASAATATRVELEAPGSGDGGVQPDGGSVASVALFAGSPGGGGSADGIGGRAFFDAPSGVAVDSQSFYVVDQGSSTLFRIDRASLKVERVAGEPWHFGYAANQMDSPVSGVTLNGKVYITDFKNNAIRSWNGTKLETTAGAPNVGGSCAGSLTSARIAAPFGITTDGARLFVTTDYNAICQIDLAKDSVVTLAGDSVAPTPGYVDGPGSVARFRSPTAMAIRGTGAAATMFVTDTNNRLVRSYDFGSMAVATVAGVQGDSSGKSGPPLSAATFCVPQGAAFLNGLLYVSDPCLQDIRVLDPTMPSSAVSIVAGANYQAGAADGQAVDARFNRPRGLAPFVDANGAASLLVADMANHVVRVVAVSNGNVTTLAGSFEHAGVQDGSRTTTARLSHPLGLATDGSTVYVADSGQGVVRAISGDTVSTMAPQPASALSSPAAIAVDSGNTLYVTDLALASVVKMVGQTAPTLVGGPTDPTLLDSPEGIATDGTTLYVSDTNHNVIRTFTMTGQSTGSLDLGIGSSTLGCSADTGLKGPTGLALDRGTRTLYVAARDNCLVFAYHLDTAKTDLVAGSTLGGADGTGSSASFDHPVGLALDGLGHLFVTDYGNATIRQIDLASRAVTTFAGRRNQAGIAVDVGQINRGVGLAYLPGTGLIASMPTENALVVVR